MRDNQHAHITVWILWDRITYCNHIVHTMRVFVYALSADGPRVWKLASPGTCITPYTDRFSEWKLLSMTFFPFWQTKLPLAILVWLECVLCAEWVSQIAIVNSPMQFKSVSSMRCMTVLRMFLLIYRVIHQFITSVLCCIFREAFSLFRTLIHLDSIRKY